MLRRARTDEVCDPCARRQGSPDIAHRLRETGLWAREPIRRALAAYDFGYLLRAVRRATELTQVELGAVLELDQDRISRIERGERPVKDIATFTRIASRLGIPPALVGFSAAAPAHISDAEPASVTHSPAALAPPPGDEDIDLEDYSEEQPAGSTDKHSAGTAQSPPLPQLCPVGDVAALLALIATAAQSVQTGTGYNELLAALRRLADRMNRRGLLQLLGVTAATAFASPLLDGLDPDERARVAAAIVQPERVDAQVINHIESVLFNAHLSNDKLGPQAALHTVIAQQQVLETMTADCPAELRPRLLSVLGHSLRSAGWISFNADDLSATRRYYERTRVVAHDAQDVELAAMVLANSSHAAESSGTPAMAVDFAIAAQIWAQRAHNPDLSAFASDIGACAFAAMSDYNTAMQHLDNTQTYLSNCPGQSLLTFYRYSEGLHVARRGKCLLKLDRTADAIQIIGESLKLYNATSPDSSLYRNINIAMAKLDLSAAHVQAGDIDEGTAMLADVAGFVSQNRANRLVKRVHTIRASLEPWQDTPVVKQLDDQLQTRGLAARGIST